MKEKIPVFPAIMTVLAFICFAAVYFIFTFFPVTPQYLKALVFAVPFAVLFTVTLCAYFGRLSGKAANILTGVLSPVFIIGSALLFIMLYFFACTDTVQDAAMYERVLARSSVDDCCSGLLPRHIPDNAEDVFFYYTPQFLQGGECFMLSFKTDDATLDFYEEKLAENAIWSGTYRQARSADKNVLYPRHKGLDSGVLPDTYVMYLLAASPEDGSGYNHALSYSVTVSRQTKEIIFHYEHW